MKLCPDTNILLRAAHPFDDPEQSRTAIELLERAEAIIITLPALCEFVWVLGSVYRLSSADIGRAVGTLLAADTVECDRRSVTLGLALAEAGGEFADGVIAEAGFFAGADQFVSFDRQAVRMISASGRNAVVPS